MYEKFRCADRVSLVEKIAVLRQSLASRTVANPAAQIPPADGLGCVGGAAFGLGVAIGRHNGRRKAAKEDMELW